MRQATKSSEKSTTGGGGGSKNWPEDDLQLLIKAVNLFPAGTNSRYFSGLVLKALTNNFKLNNKHNKIFSDHPKYFVSIRTPKHLPFPWLESSQWFVFPWCHALCVTGVTFGPVSCFPPDWASVHYQDGAEEPVCTGLTPR